MQQELLPRQTELEHHSLVALVVNQVMPVNEDAAVFLEVRKRGSCQANAVHRSGEIPGDRPTSRSRSGNGAAEPRDPAYHTSVRAVFRSNRRNSALKCYRCGKPPQQPTVIIRHPDRIERETQGISASTYPLSSHVARSPVDHCDWQIHHGSPDESRAIIQIATRTWNAQGNSICYFPALDLNPGERSIALI